MTVDDPRFRRCGRTISFLFDGCSVAAIEGQSIAAALTAAGIRALRRDRDGGSRGLYCGMGACLECMVSIDGAAGVRACLAAVADGAVVQSLDYRVPGGGPSPGSPESTAPKQAESVDVLIVGAGPAGLSAAERLSGYGLTVVLADERQGPGGQFYKQLAGSHAFSTGRATDDQYRDGAALIQKVAAAGVKILLGATVWGAERDGDGTLSLNVHCSGRPRRFSPTRLIVASGAYEEPRAFPGWTLPGVMTTGAAQGLLRSYRVVPGERIIIAGNGPLNFQLAAELVESGANVVAVSEAAPAPFPNRIIAGARTAFYGPGLTIRGLGYLRILKAARVPVLYGSQILGAGGGDRLRTVAVAPVSDNGEFDRSNVRDFDADTLCLGYGFLPSNELPRLLGCRFEFLSSGAAVPIRDHDGRSTVAEIFIVGDGGRFGGAHAAMAEGRIAAAAVLKDLGADNIFRLPDRGILGWHRRFQSALWSLYDAPVPEVSEAPADTVLCRCENVRIADLNAVIDDGVADLGNLKRLTRLGMGRCQGRNCTGLAARLLRARTGRSLAYPLFAAQTPLKPVPISGFLREQPEWSGYRPVAVDLPDAETAAPLPRIHHDFGGEVDAVVIGGGVVGASAALYLARAGLGVRLVEAGQINGQASGGNAGSLHLQLLSFDFGDGAPDVLSPALQTLRLQKAGIETWLELKQELNADFEISITGGLMVAETAEDMDFLKRKAAAEARMGIQSELLGRQDLRNLAPSVSDIMIGAAFCPGEGKIDPLRATRALVEGARACGAEIVTGVRVTSIGRDGSGYRVGADQGVTRCRYVVNAAGAWSASIARLAGISLPVSSAPQQMIATEAAAPLVGNLIAHSRRHLTLKQVRNRNLLIGGGWFAGFDPALRRPRTLSDAIAGNLWAAQRVVPALANLNMIRTWAAVGVQIDGAPILGDTPGCPGFYHAVGANGFTMGPVMGRLTADLILGHDAVADCKPFMLSRFQ